MNSFTDIYNKVVLPIYNKVSSGAFLYGYAVVALLLPKYSSVLYRMSGSLGLWCQCVAAFGTLHVVLFVNQMPG